MREFRMLTQSQSEPFEAALNQLGSLGGWAARAVGQPRRSRTRRLPYSSRLATALLRQQRQGDSLGRDGAATNLLSAPGGGEAG
jgi:hypothetical protein